MTKLQELQIVKSSGYITIPFSVVWSQDNFLAYVTDKGVNVIELRLTGLNKESSITVKRWFVKPRNFFPTNECLINVAKLGETLPPDELFKVILDRTISPKASLSSVTIHASSIAWSPFEFSLSESSFLTVLTDQGSLDIYGYGDLNLVHVGSVSDAWIGICRKGWDNNKLQDHSPIGIVNELKKRAYRVKISAFAWGKCHEKKWFSLFTGNLSGEIMKWKIEVTDTGVDICNLLLFKTDLDSVGCLNCLPLDTEDSFMLLIGCSSGKIQCLSIAKDGLKAKSMVWSDSDQMPVSLNGPVGTLLPQGILYVVPKLGHLIFFWLDSDANLINFATHSTNDICISGITWLKEGNFLICTLSGNVFTVSVTFSSFSLEVNVENCEPLSKSNSCSYHGISASRNKCIYAIPYSVCTPHDPSIVKEPSSLGIYVDSSSYTVQGFFNLNCSNFQNASDYFEILRLDMCNKKEISFEANDSLEHFESLDIVELKKAYWFKRCWLNCGENFKLDSFNDQEILCNELKRTIISYYLFMRIKNTTKENNMSDKDLEFLVCAKMWLKTYSNDGLLKSYKKKSEIMLQSLKSIEVNDVELCPLCKAECEIIGPDLMMKCMQGHQTSRCIRTLLPLMEPPYYTCLYCGETSSYGLEEYKVCLLCDSCLRINKHLLRN